MTKIAQSNFVVNRFLQIHPQLQQEIDRLKLSKPGAGLIDISDIYTNNRYWNMPSSIDEKDITTRIKQLQETKRRAHQELITGLPNWDNEFDNVIK
jgi:hypothetical protein